MPNGTLVWLPCTCSGEFYKTIYNHTVPGCFNVYLIKNSVWNISSDSIGSIKAQYFDRKRLNTTTTKFFREFKRKTDFYENNPN
jgi:hypothetical protein